MHIGPPSEIPKKGGTLDACGIHDRPHIVHPLLKCRNADGPIRQPGSALLNEMTRANDPIWRNVGPLKGISQAIFHILN